MAKVVSQICGIQAQVLPAAELAIAARVEGATVDDVRRALWTEHSLLKTWCMRGTLHVIARSDLPTYVAALKTKLDESEHWLEREGGISPHEVQAVTSEINRVLGDRALTREQLSREVRKAPNLKPETKKLLMSAWGILLRPAAYQGLLAFGENLGPRVTFVKPDWRGLSEEPSSTAAFRKLFLRFLGAYGPASIGDFNHWWGGLREEDKSRLGATTDGLVEVETDGSRGLMIRSDADEAKGLDPIHGAWLIPSFDCYAMFYSPRESFVDRDHRAKIFRATAGWNAPSVVVDGTATGTWSIKKRKGGIDVEIERFRLLSASDKKLIADEAKRIGEFLDTRVSVRYSV